MNIEEDKEYENFKNRLLQRPITFLTEENLDKLEEHCRKAIRYERGIEHKVVLELLERYKEFLAEREEDKKKIDKLQVLEDDLKDKRIVYADTPEFEEKFIPKQKVKDIAKQIQEEYDKVQEQFDCIWNKKSKDNYDRYKLQELSAMQQELGFILGKFEKLLEEGE